MKKLSSLLVIILTVLSLSIQAQSTELPAHGVSIKNPAADNANTFFSSSTSYYFEVYKVGGKEGIDHIKKSFEEDPAVASIQEGRATGDYQSFTLILKTAQTKGWFGTAFKNAGLTHIRLNRQAVIPVEKL
jgi:hypothetical protein